MLTSNTKCNSMLDNHNLHHELTDILVITILGTICRADGWTEIYEFALAKQDWRKTFFPAYPVVT